MKRLLTLLMVAAVCLLSTALAESDPYPFETPQPSASPYGFEIPGEKAAGSLTLTLDGRTLTLDFDSDPAYSLVEDGAVQASFYTYAEDDTLYELYLIFPETVSSGDTVSTQSGIQSGNDLAGVTLYITSYSSEFCAAASQYGGKAYPDGSNYVLYFEEVARANSQITFSGAFEASLTILDDQSNPTGMLDGVSGDFSFTMDMQTASSAPSFPDLPSATIPPFDSIFPPFTPDFTTPPDARKI